MKKIILKILIILTSLIFFSIQVYGTEGNTSNSNTASKVSEEKPTESPKNEVMYVKERCNIRSSYSVDSDRVGGLDEGTEVTVIAEYSNGWYKIKYDGGEAYIKSGILGSTKPDVEEEESKEEDTSSINKEKNNTDEVDNEYAELINEVGVLPEVGHNIADVLYFGVMILSIISIVIIEYTKKREG